MPPTHYDPNSAEEQPVPLPSAPLRHLSTTDVLQPPLTRRGTGPGMIVFLPSESDLNMDTTDKKRLDPHPVYKWAEEGFAVVGITIAGPPAKSVEVSLTRGIAALLDLDEVDVKDKIAVVVYEPRVLPAVLSALRHDPRIICLISYGAPLPSPSSVPAVLHLTSDSPKKGLFGTETLYSYPGTTSPYFALPQTVEYDPGAAALCHSRSLIFLRKWLGGPIFDVEAIWDEHTHFEFNVRSVAKTMGTMVAEPYVNHIPTMTGGVGRASLTEFYRDHFIFANPADSRTELVSRTIGSDRIVDEFVHHFTHDRTVDWLLPGVPPTGKKLSVPMIAIVNIRGDRLYNEHIWWDQATALLQAGVLPTHVPYPTPNGRQTLRLPAVDAAGAMMLLDESTGKSNEMFGPEWGVHDVDRGQVG